MLALGDVAEAKKTLEGIEVCYSRALGPLQRKSGKNPAKFNQNLVNIWQIWQHLAKKLAKISAIFEEKFEH